MGLAERQRTSGLDTTYPHRWSVSGLMASGGPRLDLRRARRFDEQPQGVLGGSARGAAIAADAKDR